MLVVVRLGEDLVTKCNSRRVYDLFRTSEKLLAARVRIEFQDHPNDNGTAFCIRVSFGQFPAFDKGQIPVQFGLENFLMRATVNPLQVVAHSQYDIACHFVYTHNVNDTVIFNCHWLLNTTCGLLAWLTADG